MALLGAKDEARSFSSVLKVEIRIYDDDTSLSRNVRSNVRHISSLYGVLAELGVVGLDLGSTGHASSLVSGESSSESTGTSSSEIVGSVSALGEGVFGGGASHLGEDGQDLGDVLADASDSGHLDLGSGGDLADSEGGKFFLLGLKNNSMSVGSKVTWMGTYSLEVEFLEAFLLGASSKFVGLDTVHFVDKN